MLSLIPNDGWFFTFFFTFFSNYLQLTKILSMIIVLVTLLNKECQTLVWHEEVTREGCVSVASFPGSPDLSWESLGT